jgi:hypothetical protein
MDQRSVGCLAEHIGASAPHFREFHIMPARDPESGQFEENAARQSPEDALERDVVFVHDADAGIAVGTAGEILRF